MYPLLHHDLRQFPVILQQAYTLALEFLHTLEERPTAAPDQHQLLQPDDMQLSTSGCGAENALKAFWQRYQAGFSSSPGPRYFGFVTGGVTPAALAADWLVSTIDQNTLLSHDSVAAAIELATITQLKELLGLPDDLSGSFVSGATMANFVGLATARQWLGVQVSHWDVTAPPINVAQQGVQALGTIRILSATPHSCILKACSMLGIGHDALQLIATQPGTEIMDVAALEATLIAHHGAPIIVVANAGTVNTGAFDNLQALIALRQRYSFWLHVDAAFGGVLACSSTYAPLLAGWQEADSITVDAHKWLNVPYDSAIQFTRHLALQMQVFENQSPYLEPAQLRADNYLHMTPENSRRLRAVPLWMTLKAYGREGITEIVAYYGDSDH